MKKFFLLFCFLFSIAFYTKATKQSVQDSLVNLLNTKSTTTEKKFLLYDELLMQLTRSDKNLMEEYTQEAIAFAAVHT